jgi:D-alanine-D-alanine ligase
MMKALVLSCPKEARVNEDRERFSRMVSALNQGGMLGKHYFIQSRDQLREVLLAEHPDIVFSADYYVKQKSGEKLNIHALFEELRIPYIGSTPDVLELVLSKSDLKRKWQKNGVSTPQFSVIRKGRGGLAGLETLLQAPAFPYIIKPDREGNSRGLDESSIVFDEPSLVAKVNELLKIFDSVLVEKYLGTALDIKEFTVALIGNGAHELLMPAQIVLKKKKNIRIVTTKDKDNHNTLALPVTDRELRKKLVRFSQKAFETAGVRDYSRCDLIMANGNLYAIEINGQPMIPDKWFESCAMAADMHGSQYINAIFIAGIERNIAQGKPNLKIPPRMLQNVPLMIRDRLVG